MSQPFLSLVPASGRPLPASCPPRPPPPLVRAPLRARRSWGAGAENGGQHTAVAGATGRFLEGHTHRRGIVCLCGKLHLKEGGRGAPKRDVKCETLGGPPTGCRAWSA